MSEPVAIFRNGEESVTVYSDGAYIEMLGPGADAYCSEHGVLNQGHDANVEQCDHDSAHDEAGKPTVPVHELSDVFDTLENTV